MKELNDVTILVNVSMAAVVQSLKKGFPFRNPQNKNIRISFQGLMWPSNTSISVATLLLFNAPPLTL